MLTFTEKIQLKLSTIFTECLIIIKKPNKSKLKFFASAKHSMSERMYERYEDIVKDVTFIREMIRKELKN